MTDWRDIVTMIENYGAMYIRNHQPAPPSWASQPILGRPPSPTIPSATSQSTAHPQPQSQADAPRPPTPPTPLRPSHAQLLSSESSHSDPQSRSNPEAGAARPPRSTISTNHALGSVLLRTLTSTNHAHVVRYEAGIDTQAGITDEPQGRKVESFAAQDFRRVTNAYGGGELPDRQALSMAIAYARVDGLVWKTKWWAT